MQKLIGVFLLIACYNLPAQKTFITISGPAQGNATTPVHVKLSKPLVPNSSYQLFNILTRKTIPAQQLDSVTLVFMAAEKSADGNLTYQLIPGRKANNQGPVSIEKQDNGLLVKVNGKPVFFYHTKEAMPPPDSPAYYRRSGFIHPVYSPSGKILTDDFPLGHVHQHAIFTAWTNTTFKKSPVDFWNQQSKKGTVEHIEVSEVIQGPVVCQLKTSLRHKSVEFGEVLKEKWTITIYPFNDYYLFDLESEQLNTTTDTLFLNKYHYGGLAFRGSSQWNHDDPKNFKGAWSILTSEGIRDSSANATHARWVDAWGNIDGGIAGITVFNHPSNFRYPQALRVHPIMPYWAYSPMVDGPFYIAPGAFYRSKFRYFVHDGQVQPAVIEKLFAEWAYPLNIKVSYQ